MFQLYQFSKWGDVNGLYLYSGMGFSYMYEPKKDNRHLAPKKKTSSALGEEWKETRKSHFCSAINGLFLVPLKGGR